MLEPYLGTPSERTAFLSKSRRKRTSSGASRRNWFDKPEMMTRVQQDRTNRDVTASSSEGQETDDESW